MDTKILLSASWVVTTLIYLYDDVFRIVSGDFAKKMGDMKFSQVAWFGLAVLMLIPILMVFLTFVLPQSVSRWTNIIIAAFFFLFNLVGLPSYMSLYDKFFIAVSLVFNCVTFYYALKWTL
jgi:hypothetical protein